MNVNGAFTDRQMEALRLMARASQAEREYRTRQEEFRAALRALREARTRRRETRKELLAMLSGKIETRQISLPLNGSATSANGAPANGSICEPARDALRDLHPGIDV